MYRFGDGTPFPLRENFIDTIVAAVDCCVALYRVEVDVEERMLRQREAEKSATEELRRLDALKALIETAVAPLLAPRADRGTRPSEHAAARVFHNAEEIIQQGKTEVASLRERITLEDKPTLLRERVRAALSDAFRAHALPRTEWRVRWQAPASTDGIASADIGAQSTRDLELSFLTTIPDDHEWARAMTVSELLSAPIETIIDTGNGKRRTVRLDTYALTEVHIAPGRESIILRESARRASPGLHIVLPRAPGETPLVVPLDKRDRAGQPFCLDEAGADGVRRLWQAIDERLPELIALRGGLAGARLRGQDLEEMDHPSELAEAMLMSLAPLVREMRMRSRVPGELILKRDLAGDRREEMFVPRQVLWEKIGGLPSRHRQVFEAIGLGNEATTEFVTRVGGSRQVPAVRAPDAAARAASMPTQAIQSRDDHSIVEPLTFGGDSEVEPTSTRASSKNYTAVSGVIELRVPKLRSRSPAA
jgi:hypothetical protein